MELNFSQAGSGPPLLLIHGLFGSLENLGGIARLLAQQFCVYSIDLPNHGRSPHTDSLSLTSLADAVANWLELQQLGQVNVVGHSLGGKVGMELALNKPACVDNLIVMDIAPVKYPPHHDEVFAGLAAIPTGSLATRNEADEILAAFVPETPVRSFLLKNLVKKGKGYAWRMNLPLLRQRYDEISAANTDGAHFHGDVLFIKGGDSKYIQEKHRQAILSRFPKADVKIVPGTGHLLHAEKPELIAGIITRFINH